MNRRWMRIMAATLLAFGAAFIAIAGKAVPINAVYAAQASSMALIEAETGEVLASENAGARLPMASTTKIMTALITLENCDPDELVEIPDEAVGVEGSSIGLGCGETMTVRDLVYGLMLASGNDAAIALAVHVAGSVPAFVDMMNARAEEMGLEKTHFITPNGLHAQGHLTTAYELCLLTAEAIKNEAFRTVVSTKYYEAESGIIPRTFKNKNSLLWDYDGAFGVKTGYTMAAGRCLVFGAERDGMTVIGAVLNCRPMFQAAAELMDYAFSEYSKEIVADKSETAARVFVENSENCILEVCPKESIITVMHRSEERSFRTEVRLNEHISAPVKAGQTVGELTVTLNGEIAGRTDLVAASDVKTPGLRYWMRFVSSVFAA